MKLCSACLLGIKCRYDGKSKPNAKVLALAKKEILISVCPEQLGGQQTPRPNSEIENGDGNGVLINKSKVIEHDGTNVSREFIKGAEETLKIAKLNNCNEAIMKSKSPSCGCGEVYDGTFFKNLITGDGVTTALLKNNGIKVITENDL